MWKEKYKGLSDFGDGPNDQYMVYSCEHGTRKDLQIGCFVLRPAREKIAFKTLCFFIDELTKEMIEKDKEDERLDILRNWRERLQGLWKEK